MLFTNAELMRKVAGSLEGFFAEEGLLALVQGNGWPRHVMLKAFRRAGRPPETQISEPQRSEVSKDQNTQPSVGPSMAEKLAHRSHEPCEFLFLRL